MKDGRGLFTHAGVRMSAPRAAILRSGQSLGRDQMACHHCDNPACVNLAHLYVGDAKSNARDAWLRNRFPSRKGDHHPRVKIPDSAIASIRVRVASGETRTALAQELGVSQAHISRIVLGKNRVNV